MGDRIAVEHSGQAAPTGSHGFGAGRSSASRVEKIGEARRSVDERPHAHEPVVAAPGAPDAICLPGRTAIRPSETIRRAGSRSGPNMARMPALSVRLTATDSVATIILLIGEGCFSLASSPKLKTTDPCLICGSASKIEKLDDWRLFVDCSRCGDFEINDTLFVEYQPAIERNDKSRALLSYNIRKLQLNGRANLSREFFERILEQSLPSPAEATDNLLLELVEQTDRRPGRAFSIREEPRLLSVVGVVGYEDIHWIVNNLRLNGLVEIELEGIQPYKVIGYATGLGWSRADELKRAHVASNYAFFARRFANDELDKIYEECLRPSSIPSFSSEAESLRRTLRFGVGVLGIARLGAAAWPLACWE